MKLIHLTDTHFGDIEEKIYGRDPKENFDLAIKHINENQSDADFAIITGDLAHEGKNGAYKRLKESLDALNMPFYLVVGNHDDRTLLIDNFPQVPRDENGFIQYRFEHDEKVFIVLDTVKEGTHDGDYCALRQQWLDQQLSATDKPVYILMHHSPFATGIPTMDRMCFQTEVEQQVTAIFKKHRHIQHIFFGHYHRPISGQWQGISFSTLKAMNHQVALDLVTTGNMVPGSFESPSYNVVLLQPELTVVHTCDYTDDSERFML